MIAFQEQIGGRLQRREPTVLQVNVGKFCNQTCGHCHVDAGPQRTEIMTAETAAQAIAILDQIPSLTTLDITGGAPELNENFRALVAAGRERCLEVIDRCNLTVLMLPGQRDLARFLAENNVRVIASLPCYTEGNVDAQRGEGVYRKSIEALQLLNGWGYGRGGGLELDLVYNPLGAGLPGPQADLQADYKRRLAEDHGIVFDRLFTITNMPIERFEKFLHAMGKFEAYMDKLIHAYNPGTVDALMCRDMISVSWDGYIYDCDFNQMLDMKVHSGRGPLHISAFDAEAFLATPIRTANHCYGCTAGAGSSCGGTLAETL